MATAVLQTVQRLEPRTVAEYVESGLALLVCAYEDDAKFGRMALESAIPLSELRLLEPLLARDQRLIFYCA
jgi:hypothetical protein